MKVAIVGRGLIGSAAARHLSNAGHEVVLIGPGEPPDKAGHAGVFGSHYDEGRITRALDPAPFWSRVSRASIARYAEIEKVSGIRFFSDVGAMMAGPAEGAFIRQVDGVRREAGIAADAYAGQALAERFPYFSFPDGTRALHEVSGAGHISPRRLVKAQGLAAARAGARCIDAPALGLSEARGSAVVETEERTVFADRVLVAAGGFTNMLMPKPLPVKVYARTVALFEVDEAEAERLSGMPSLIHLGPNAEDPYLLPPIRYPDGRIYLKLGGDPEHIALKDTDAVKAWFRGGGSAAVAERLTAQMRERMPGLAIRSVRREPCVTTYTARGTPIIALLSERLAVAVAGCGRGAKCSDELGRQGAEAVLGRGDPALGLP